MASFLSGASPLAHFIYFQLRLKLHITWWAPSKIFSSSWSRLSHIALPNGISESILDNSEHHIATHKTSHHGMHARWYEIYNSRWRLIFRRTWILLKTLYRCRYISTRPSACFNPVHFTAYKIWRTDDDATHRYKCPRLTWDRGTSYSSYKSTVGYRAYSLI